MLEHFDELLKSTTAYHEKPYGMSFEAWRKTVCIGYVGMCVDLLHMGHLNILRFARHHANIVVVGVLTDQAMCTYKKIPIMPFHERVEIVRSIRYVDMVVSQETLSYVPNLEAIRPTYLIHGDDWRSGVQKKTRQDALKTLEKNSGTLIEPEYFKGVSSTQLIERIRSH